MKTNIYVQKLIFITALVCTVSVQGMGKSLGDNLIASIQTDINKLKSAQKTTGIEEVNSPEIQKEHQKILKTIINNAKQLDNFIKTLPSSEQSTWLNKQAAILEPAKNVLKDIISENISSTWRQHGKALAQAAMDGILAGVTTAAIGLVTQGIKMGTGNLLALDTETLLLTGLTATAGAALNALTASQSTLLLYATPNTFNESLIVPSITNYSYTFKTPSIKGPITSWIVNEACIIAEKMIEEGGGMGKMLGSINLTKTLLPTPNKKLGTPSNELVAAALPTVQSIVKNNKIASVLTEVGWVVTQSAMVGGLLYLAGFGYAETTMTQSIGYAVMTGIAQGALASVATLGRVVSPGAIINITSAPLAQQALVIAGGTQQGAVTVVIQATVTEVSNVLLSESQKNGGLTQTLKRGGELLGQAVRKRWWGTWTTIVDIWETIKSIEPVPL